MVDPEHNTKERILEAAEKLFADKGIHGTSLRAIIKAAGVNTAAVHYHFGSREALIAAVIGRRAEPINRARLDGLRRLEAQHPSGPLPLEGLIEAFIAPMVRMRFGGDPAGELFPRLMGSLLTEPDARLREILAKTFGEVFMRFGAAFSRSLPNLSPDEVQWRMHFMIGAMAFTVAVPRIAGGGEPGSEATAMLLERLVDFVAAGMRTGIPEKA